MMITGEQNRLQRFVDGDAFTVVVAVVVVINAIVLGMATAHDLGPRLRWTMTLIDRACLAFFVVEMALKLAAFRLRFFFSAWRVFDLFVVVVSLIPAAGPFSVLRILRVLRMLRIVSVVKPLRRVVEALVRAVPGIGAILSLLAIFLYMGAVLSTNLFGAQHEELFGSLGASVITLFQLMLFDGWAGEVVRVVEETHPWASLYFIAFTVLTGFAVLNLFIAVMVDALREEHDRLQTDELERIERSQRGHQVELNELESAVRELSTKIDALIEAQPKRAPDEDAEKERL